MANNTDNTVFILDSYGLIYRAYYALLTHPLTNTNGQNISALVLFFRNLKALLSKYKPHYLAAAFDSRTPTFRHQMYKEYKATRQKTPDDLHAQVPWIEECLKSLGIPVLRVDGFEADDIIATVAKKCQEQNRPCRILSGDKDLLQLVNQTCKEMQPDKANGGWETQGIEEVQAKWGIPPEKILDYLSLVGDSSDNVPGVKGIGEKTAIKLLNEYNTLDGIYEHAQEIKGAIGNKIRDGKEDAYFSKKLITLRQDVPLELDFDTFCTDCLNYNAASKVLLNYGAVAVSKSYATLQDGSIEQIDSLQTNDEQDSTTQNVTECKKNVGNYKAITQEEELTKLIDSILSSTSKEVAFDTETDSLNTQEANLVGFSLSNKAGEGFYIPVILPGGMFAPQTIAKDKCIEQIARLLNCKDFTIIMHNAKFDLQVLFYNGIKQKPLCKIVDTMIASWLLAPDAQGKSPYSLEYLGETELNLIGVEFSSIVPKGKTIADIPLEVVFPYGAEDADFTWQLWQKHKPLLTQKNLESLFYDIEMKVLPILAQMEQNGIHLDKNALQEYGAELKQEIELKEQQIYKEAGCSFNIASPKQLQEVLFTKRGLVPSKKTKSGYSTDTSVLEELCQRTTDPLPQYILDYRSRTKLLGTYVETLPTLTDKESKIHTSFLQTGTATGRLSSRDPNLQNIPVKDEAGRKIRSAFTAQKGTKLISADYSQIELVVLAHLSGDANLCKAFIEGVDVHKSTAALIYGIEAQDVTAQMRRFAKTVNFGVMYGMSAFRLANELSISRTEAKNFIDQYFTTYADVKNFINKTIENAQKLGYSETIMGRRREIKNINSSNKLEQQAAQRIAVNTPIQGSAADIVKKAMIDVQNELEKTNSPAKLILQVHDELIFSCPDDNSIIEQTIALITDKMEHAVKLKVPLRVSVEHGSCWGEFH